MRIIIIIMAVCTAQLIQAQLQSPSDFFGYAPGKQFTPHHRLVDYFEHVAEESPLVTVEEYGRTSEGRPLIVAYITNQENQKSLDQYRRKNMQLAGMDKSESLDVAAKSIVWLSFSVHGNEAAGSESSPSVIYDLVNPNNTRTKAWLNNTIVVIDPAVNPDGYSRYTHWHTRVASAEVNSNFDDIEHQEPWPGGRTNHYLFDLNRDWAWQTQIESQQRMKLYNQWLPHIHADLHEMGHNSPYYFAPAAKPYHEYITEWQKDFQTDIGKNHAKYFDKEGWLYFTKEVFDLLYPSYGDTYPTFSGGIGMTYEQGGSGRGGRAVKTNNGEVLTLKDRINHHKTTALSTVEMGATHSDRLISEFKKFYSKAPAGKYRAYIIKAGSQPSKVEALSQLLYRQGIKYGTVSSDRSGNGYNYQTGTNTSFVASPGDLVVSAEQAKSVLTQVLLDPESSLEDSLTYDITAWSLPYAYGLEAYATTKVFNADESLSLLPEQNKMKLNAAYAYIIPADGLYSFKLASHLMEAGVTARVNHEPVTFSGDTYDRGSVIITRADNMSIQAELLDILNTAIADQPATIVKLNTGFADSGKDLGSSSMSLLQQPKVLSIRGDRVSALSFGQVRHYFDQVIEYPLTVVDISRLSQVDLNDYNTIILPDGYYSLSDHLTTLASWVSNGGKLIAIGSTTTRLADTDGFGLVSEVEEGQKEAIKEENKLADLAARYNHYSDAERESISSFVPGAIIKLHLDPTHPLSFGLGDEYFSLRTSSTHFPLQTDAINVGRIPKDPMIIGFIGSKVRKRIKDTVAFAVEEKGRGQIIYMVDNPLFRGFWINGQVLFSNALFLVN